MEIRPYISSDFEEIKTWISDERSHALWCADLIPYPLEHYSFEKTLKGLAVKNKDIPFSVITDEGQLIGFLCYSFNSEIREGKLKFIILAPSFRGKGYGKKMLSLVLKYAFDTTKAGSIQLNVFENNTRAKKCYLSFGFTEREITENAFTFNKETWARCNMVIKNIGIK